MRHLNEFSAREWLELLPLQHAAKQIRNDVWLSLYKSRHPQALDEFLAQTRHLAGKNIAAVIAFEQPWVLNWLLRMANRNLSDPPCSSSTIRVTNRNGPRSSRPAGATARCILPCRRIRRGT